MCPQDKLAAAYKSGVRVMGIGTFRTILSKLPSDIRLHFSGFSEPLLNPLCCEIMHEASDAGREIHLFTTLSGLTGPQVFQLTRTKFAYIRLHVPEATGFKMDTNIWLRRFKMFTASGQRFTAMAMSEQVDPAIVEALSQHGVRVEYPTMLSRGGLLWKDRHLTGPIRCAADRWHQNVVLPNGDVQVCCMSYNLSMPCGNLLRQPYSEIEAKANEYAANSNPPDDSICRYCDWAAPL